MTWAPWLCLLGFTLPPAFAGTRAVEWDDLPPALQNRLAEHGVARTGFHRFRLSLERSTAARLRDGEADEIVYFLLQSASFTRLPRIEPAASARQLVDSLAPGERRKYLDGERPARAAIPAAVDRRIDEFAAALARPGGGARLADFRKDRRITREWLRDQYLRAMRFLYRKEFEGRRGADLAALYRERGHSTDTRMEANFAVWSGLKVLHALDPNFSVAAALVVGPGLDFAPRTALYDRLPPQSYQPFALADALLSLGMAAADWRIGCIDINPRVLKFLASRPRRLVALKSAAGEEYDGYFSRAGRAIGAVRQTDDALAIDVRADVAARIAAGRLNILTERYHPAPGYDLAVATNVLVYFGDAELALALANLRAMMKPGGYLIHNELRGEGDTLLLAAGFEPVQARTLRFSGDLFDAFAIYRAR